MPSQGKRKMLDLKRDTDNLWGMKAKVTDAALRESYSRLGSVWKVGEELGISGQTAHARLVALGIDTAHNLFTMDDEIQLKREYRVYRDAGKLDDLAKSMGRTKQFLCRQARRLGLTDKTAPKRYGAVWKYVTQETARVMMDDFKSSSLGLGQYCKLKGYDDLGFSRTLREFFPDEYEPVIESKAPMQSMYRLGRSFEYSVRDHLRKLGYVVMRSPASKSPIDLIAVRAGGVTFIQCKRSGALPPGEWNEFFDLCVSAGALPLLAQRKAGNRGVDYHRLVGRKDGTKRAQPMQPHDPS